MGECTGNFYGRLYNGKLCRRLVLHSLRFIASLSYAYRTPLMFSNVNQYTIYLTNVKWLFEVFIAIRIFIMDCIRFQKLGDLRCKRSYHYFYYLSSDFFNKLSI